jgi:hypothetical protein
MAEMSEKYEGLAEMTKRFASKPDDAKIEESSDQDAE